MKIVRNKELEGPHGKPILLDVFYEDNGVPKPIVIFVHGFKGFKDWGHFDLMAEHFAHQGFVFVKFNFSHGGITKENLTEFSDLEGFGNNNFTIEMDDLGAVINWILEEKEAVPAEEMDGKKLYLVGHSRGGGIVILKAREDERVKKIVTWASVSEFGKYWNEAVMEIWKEEGVQYIPNARTGQDMPMYFQIYENYFANLERLHIPTAAKDLKIPALFFHGTDDEAVPYQSGQDLEEWVENGRLITVEGGNHTFGGKHPWESPNLPEHAQHVIEETVSFLKK